MNQVLVTGATGSVGSSLVPELSDRGVPVRVFSRDLDAAGSLFGSEVDYALGDFDDLASVERAVEGVDQVFLASPNHPRQQAWEIAIIDAAVGAGVRRIVKLSAIGAEVGSPLAFWDAHGRIEAHLRDSDPAAVAPPPRVLHVGTAGVGGGRQGRRAAVPARRGSKGRDDRSSRRRRRGGMFGLIRTGALNGISGDVQDLLAREPRRFGDFAADAGVFS